jgi:acetyltransferase-like isoleucine patch superfamily enzyme
MFTRPLELFFKATIALLPWAIKRQALVRLYGYQLDPRARIGLAWIYPQHLKMAAGARIASFTIAIHLDCLELAEQASIGRGNWITGFSTGSSSRHFVHQVSRRSELYLGAHSAVTKYHHIDATNSIAIGPFTTIAGYGSQLLSHSIDLQHNRQHSLPITIGAYCFVGTSCVILGGSVLPDHSVLGALSLLNKPHGEPWSLYGGQPARRLKPIDSSAAYFCRSRGFVD